MTLRQAYTLVKQRRPEINPNPLFFKILEEFERELTHSRLMMMNKSAALVAAQQQRNNYHNQYNEYNNRHQPHNRLMRPQHTTGAFKYYTLKPSMYGAANSSSMYNQRSMSPMPMMSGGAQTEYTSIANVLPEFQQKQPYAF